MIGSSLTSRPSFAAAPKAARAAAMVAPINARPSVSSAARRFLVAAKPSPISFGGSAVVSSMLDPRSSVVAAPSSSPALPAVVAAPASPIAPVGAGAGALPALVAPPVAPSDGGGAAVGSGDIEDAGGLSASSDGSTVQVGVTAPPWMWIVGLVAAGAVGFGVYRLVEKKVGGRR